MFVSRVEALTPNVMVLGTEASGKQLGLADVMRVGPHGGIHVPIRRHTSAFALCKLRRRCVSTQLDGSCL